MDDEIEIVVRRDEAEPEGLGIAAVRKRDGHQLKLSDVFSDHQGEGFRRIVAVVALEGTIPPECLKYVKSWRMGSKTAASRIAPLGRAGSTLAFRDGVTVRVEGDLDILREHLLYEPWLSELVTDAEAYEKAETKGDRQELVRKWQEMTWSKVLIPTESVVQRFREVGMPHFRQALLAARIGAAEDSNEAALEALLKVLADDTLRGRPAYPILNAAISLHKRLGPQPKMSKYVPAIEEWSRKGGADTSVAARRLLEHLRPSSAAPGEGAGLRWLVGQAQAAVRGGRMDEALGLLERIARMIG